MAGNILLIAVNVKSCDPLIARILRSKGVCSHGRTIGTVCHNACIGAIIKGFGAVSGFKVKFDQQIGLEQPATIIIV